MNIIYDYSIRLRKFNCIMLDFFIILSLWAAGTTGLSHLGYVIPSSFGSSNTYNSNGTNNSIDSIQGNPFYSENTKSTNIKVLNIDPVPTVEVTYTGNSTIGGAPTETIGTIVDKMNTDGSVSSKGQAIILTALGQVLTYRSESIGNYNPDGSFSDSGIMVFHMPFQMNSGNSTGGSSNSTDTLYTQFDNLFGIYKKTVDAEGNGLTKVWKWR